MLVDGDQVDQAVALLTERNRAQGSRVPISCDAYGCPVCGPKKTKKAAELVAWATRSVGKARFVTLGGAPDTHAQRRDRMKKLRQRMVAAGYRWEHAWVATSSAPSTNRWGPPTT